MANNRGSKSKRGLASASDETKERVARAGGKAQHDKRGQKNSNNP